MSQASFMWSKHLHALCKGGSWTHTESVPWAQACEQQCWASGPSRGTPDPVHLYLRARCLVTGHGQLFFSLPPLSVCPLSTGLVWATAPHPSRGLSVVSLGQNSPSSSNLHAWPRSPETPPSLRPSSSSYFQPHEAQYLCPVLLFLPKVPWAVFMNFPLFPDNEVFFPLLKIYTVYFFFHAFMPIVCRYLKCPIFCLNHLLDPASSKCCKCHYLSLLTSGGS